MKDHRFLALGACALALTLLPAAAHADKPPAGDKPGEHAAKPGDHGKPDDHGKSDDHGKPDGAKSDKEPNGERGEHGKPGTDDGSDKRDGHRGDAFRGGMRQLQEDLKAGKVKKEELKDKLAKLRESAGERGKEHRQELSKRWGGTLALPPAREELKNHARRMAFLNRAMVLAETEAKDKDKLTARISKLIDKENERHDRAMEHFKSLPAAAASAAMPAASAAPAAAASGQGVAK